MKRKIAWLITLVLTVFIFISCSAPVADSLSPAALKGTTLSLGSLPAAGYLKLAQLNFQELDRLGLAGPAPINAPPSSPYNSNGLYWSEPFSLVEGDTLIITIDSTSPVSWFGVDWSSFDLRGVLATTEVDEDGRAFDPQYPVESSSVQSSNGYKLTVSYKIQYDADCVVVVKNANPNDAQQLNLSAALKPSISFRRIAKRIPLVRNLVAPEPDMD
jgi:hypothetical protein